MAIEIEYRRPTAVTDPRKTWWLLTAVALFGAAVAGIAGLGFTIMNAGNQRGADVGWTLFSVALLAASMEAIAVVWRSSLAANLIGFVAMVLAIGGAMVWLFLAIATAAMAVKHGRIDNVTTSFHVLGVSLSPLLVTGFIAIAHLRYAEILRSQRELPDRYD